MQTFTIEHEFEAPYGWGFRCDEIRMSGSSEDRFDYAASRQEAEAVVRFYLAGEAEDRGETPLSLDAVRIEHIVAARETAAA